MSWTKINHFHWHIVDSQSFPLVVPGFEEISSKGAYSSAQVYTPNDVKDIVQYAAAVRVLCFFLWLGIDYVCNYSAELTLWLKLILQGIQLSSQNRIPNTLHVLRLLLGPSSLMVRPVSGQMLPRQILY